MICGVVKIKYIENHWRQKTRKRCFLEMTMKAFITAILVRA